MSVATSSARCGISASFSHTFTSRCSVRIANPCDALHLLRIPFRSIHGSVTATAPAAAFRAAADGGGPVLSAPALPGLNISSTVGSFRRPPNTLPTPASSPGPPLPSPPPSACRLASSARRTTSSAASSLPSPDAKPPRGPPSPPSSPLSLASASEVRRSSIMVPMVRRASPASSRRASGPWPAASLRAAAAAAASASPSGLFPLPPEGT